MRYMPAYFSEVHAEFYDTPKDHFLGNLQTQDDYLPDTSLVDGINIVKHNTQRINFNEVLGGNRNRVALLGSAGSGKSVTMRRLAKNVAHKRIRPLRNIELVIFIELRKLVKTEPVFLYDFIFEISGKELEISQKVDLLKWMLKKKLNVLFVLDGLDQLKHDIPVTTDITTRVWDKSTQMKFLRDLLIGNIFKQSKVIFSSREFAIEKFTG